MKKLLILIIAICFGMNANAQDSTTEKGLSTEVSLMSQHIDRGIAFTTMPSFEGNMSYKFCNWFTLGVEGYVALNETPGYGSGINTYASITKKELSLTIKDYFYSYGYTAETNDYFDYGDNTPHYIEASLKYKNDNFYGLVAYTIHQAQEYDEATGIYFEAGYNVTKNIQFNAGYVTDASGVNFRTDNAMTHVGIVAQHEIKVSDSWNPTLKTALYVNPETETILRAEGVSTAPINFIVGITF